MKLSTPLKMSAPRYKLKRRARLLARESGMPLHRALDRTAQDEGFRSWSHLAAETSGRGPAPEILAALSPGDLVLLGARPGQGKTLLGLDLIAQATKTGRAGHFFTLDYHDGDVLDCLGRIGVDPKSLGPDFALDTSDDICADYIAGRLDAAPRGAVAVIDYLQLLDQRRRNPALAHQIPALKTCAEETGVVVVLISQIDRAFDLKAKPMPDLSDIRLPNPVDLSLFAKTCFLHDGTVRLDAVA